MARGVEAVGLEPGRPLAEVLLVVAENGTPIYHGGQADVTRFAERMQLWLEGLSVWELPFCVLALLVGALGACLRALYAPAASIRFY